MGGLALANGVFYGLTSCSGSNLPPDSVNGFEVVQYSSSSFSTPFNADP
jgi:hypothetical protein